MSHHWLRCGEIHKGRDDTLSVKGTKYRSSAVHASCMYASGSASGLNTCALAIGAMSRQNSVVAASGMGSSPYVARHVDDQAQFRGLLAHLDIVAMVAAREATLRRQRELVQRRIF